MTLRNLSRYFFLFVIFTLGSSLQASAQGWRLSETPAKAFFENVKIERHANWYGHCIEKITDYVEFGGRACCDVQKHWEPLALRSNVNCLRIVKNLDRGPRVVKMRKKRKYRYKYRKKHVHYKKMKHMHHHKKKMMRKHVKMKKMHMFKMKMHRMIKMKHHVKFHHSKHHMHGLSKPGNPSAPST